jgi:hypothetical protein
VLRILKRTGLLVGAIGITLMAVRVYDTRRGPPLELWHTFASVALSADELDDADWSRYLAAEQAVFDEVRVEVTPSLTRETACRSTATSMAVRAIQGNGKLRACDGEPRGRERCDGSSARRRSATACRSRSRDRPLASGGHGI